MAFTDELKILDDKIKANQAQYDLGREAAKISALSSKDLLEKYEYLTAEDLGHRPSVLEKTNVSILHKVYKSFRTDNVKNIANRESDFNYDSKHSFYRFYKEYKEFEKMPLDSKHKKMRKFTNLPTVFKNVKSKNSKAKL